MRADTWQEVGDGAVDFARTLWSRLRYYLPRERARRAEWDAMVEARVNAFLGAKTVVEDDAALVDRWMAESGFTAQSWSEGMSEQEEGAITAATEVFRQRLIEILGHDKFSFDINIGLDSDDDSP